MTDQREEVAEFAPDHNGPPIFVADASDALRRRLEAFKPRRDELAAKAAKVVIRTREDVGAAADLIGIAREVEKMVGAAAAEIGGPYADAARAVASRAKEFWSDVEEAIEQLRGRMDTFAREERERIRQQEDEQREEDARRRAARAGPATAAPPPAPPAAPPKRRAYRGDYGHQAIARDEDVIEIVDPMQLPAFVFEAARVKEAIIATLKPLVKQKVPIAGIKVSSTVKTEVRR